MNPAGFQPSGLVNVRPDDPAQFTMEATGPPMPARVAASDGTNSGTALVDFGRMSVDARAGTFDLEIHPGYPLPPPDAVVHSETGERVSAALENALLDLSAREFLLVAAKFRDGLSQREIAGQLDISEQRVSVLMTRALDRIREAVRRDVPDETAAQWPSRYGLGEILKSVIARLLDRRPPA